MSMQSINPMHQFEINNLFLVSFFDTFYFYITNLNLVFTSVILTFFVFGFLFKKHSKLMPNKFQIAIESFIESVYTLVENNLNGKAKIYSNYIFSIFVFLLISNLYGLAPFSFAITSHISVTIAVALLVFLSTLIILLFRKGFRFFGTFIPHGTPTFMAPLIFVLELFSFFIRPVSLSVRLASNMIAGHVLVEILAIFVIMLKYFGFLPFLFLYIITLMEIGVCLLQAYIFTIFTCVYINEAFEH